MIALATAHAAALLLLLGGWHVLSTAAVAQVPADSLAVPLETAAALEDLEEAVGDPALLAERLVYLAEHPLDLNRADAEELSQLPALSPLLVEQILRHRSAHGPFPSVAALMDLEGLDTATYEAVRPFLYVAAPTEARAAARALGAEFVQRLDRRLDLSEGYLAPDPAYAGSPERLYTRLTTHYRRHVRLNLTLEKDPGERFAWNPGTRTYGYDFTSAHVALEAVGPLKTLVVGDFTATFGQGITLWRSSAFGKGADPVRPLVRSGGGLTPYRGRDEDRFFRGFAAEVMLWPGLSASAFFSRRHRDAAALAPDTSTQAFTEVRGFSEGGLHRLPLEIDRKATLGEQVLGGNLTYRHRLGQLGAVGYRTRFSAAFAPGFQAYRRFDFTGTRANMLGVFGHLLLGDVLLYGEVARDANGRPGGTGGLQARLSDRAEVLMAARAYPHDFISLYGYAFGDRNGATQNEIGFYTGLQLRLSRAWMMAAYVDQYRFPWLRFAVPRPTSGHDMLVRLTYQPRRWLRVYAQGRADAQEAASTTMDAAGRALDAVGEDTRLALRLHAEYVFSRQLSLQGRIEGVRSAPPDAPAAYGLLFYQEVRWQPRRRLRLDARLGFFDVDRFDARVYAYERDLLYAFSVPAFSGRGQRSYLLLHYQPLGRLSLQAKYAATRFEDVRSVGSGPDRTEGNQIRELRLQLRWRY